MELRILRKDDGREVLQRRAYANDPWHNIPIVIEAADATVFKVSPKPLEATAILWDGRSMQTILDFLPSRWTVTLTSNNSLLISTPEFEQEIPMHFYLIISGSNILGWTMDIANESTIRLKYNCKGVNIKS